MGIERRQYARYQISQSIKLSMGHESFFEAESIDISAGGLRCRSTYSLEPLARIYLMLRLPAAAGERVLQTEASVVHVRKVDDAYEYGVQFDPLPQEDRDALNAYLASLP
jgi:c-di-GMP-binding flagellar brake protein YcgR